MKTTMKFFTYGLMILTLIFTSCSKDGTDGTNGLAGIDGIDGSNGSDGADGEDGTDGTDGEDGEDGSDGNANVEILTYDIETFTSSVTYTMEGITEAKANDNLILGYYGREFTEVSGNGGILNKTQWIAVPGKAHNNTFESRAIIETSSFATNSSFIVSLHNNDGTDYNTQTTFIKFKIFVIPPTNIAGKNNSIDLRKMTYEEVISHLGFEE